jgi:hypothetical protein
MNEVLLSALLGTLGGTLAAILSYLAARHTAKQEIQKLELANRQKQDETYFANARLHIETLYLPLNSNLTALDTAFELYDHRCKLGDEVKAREDFHDACEKCIEQITQLTSQGKDAYITVRL